MAPKETQFAVLSRFLVANKLYSGCISKKNKKDISCSNCRSDCAFIDLLSIKFSLGVYYVCILFRQYIGTLLHNCCVEDTEGGGMKMVV